MALRESLDTIVADTETHVGGLYARRRGGELSEEQFQERAARTVDQANRRAAAESEKAVYAEKRAQQGVPSRPAGASRPPPDRERLKGAVATTGEGDDDERATRLARLAKSEPYSTAQDTIHRAAKKAGARGWVRAINPGACRLCTKWADGKVRSFETKMVRHPGCTCLQKPRYGPAKRQRARRAAVKQAALAVVASPADEIAIAAGTAAGTKALHAAAIHRYMLGAEQVNAKLRSRQPLGRLLARLVTLIDRALESNRTPEALTVYRTLGADTDVLVDLPPTVLFRDEGYVSAFVSRQAAEELGGGSLLALKVPKGTPSWRAPYRGLPFRSLRRITPFAEDEILLPRGMVQRVTRVDRDQGRLVVSAEVIPSRATPPHPSAGRIVSMAQGPPVEEPFTVGVPTPSTAKGVRRPKRAAKMSAALIPDARIGDVVERAALVPGFEDFAGRTDRKALGAIVKRMADNILASAERSYGLSPEATELHASWYPFAHDWLNRLADAHRTSRNSAYAAAAVLSPGADWANNVAWAQRMIEAISTQTSIVVKQTWIDRRFETAMAAWETSLRKAKPSARAKILARKPTHRQDLVGKRLVELPDADAAEAMRGWHDAEPLHQLGGVFGFGDPKKIAVPNTMEALVKAVSVLRNPTLENIDRQLGQGQKVRSFFMNLAHPLDRVYEHVTVDTHHFGIAAGSYPWSTSSRFISSGSSNITDTPNIAVTGVGGVYPLVVDATRQATRTFNRRHGTNYLPNQIQSITWEQHRADLPPAIRRKGLVEPLMAAIEQAHTDRALGRISPAKERRLIEQAIVAAGGPTLEEIAEWYLADLEGRPRLSLAKLRDWMRKNR